MEAKKKSIMDRVTDFTMKIAEPLGRFADIPCIAAIQNGLVSVMPLIIIGSIFLILGIMGTDAIGGKVLLPFLAPISGKLTAVNALTMNFLGFYAALMIAMNYAEKIGADAKTCGLLGTAAFFVFNLNGVTDDMIPVLSFSATGLFVGILVSLFSVRIYKFLLDKNITIKMPASVPPNVGNAFTSMIPFAVVITIAWLIRTVLGFNMVEWFTTALQPFITAADNIWMYTFNRGMTALLWGVGLHGDNMFNVTIFQPFTMMWADQNAAAMAAGEPLTHIWTNYGIDRITSWTALVWPLLLLMIRSKVKYLRTFGWACLPAAIFTIVEPVIFGLPLALNPFLIIPFLLIAILTAIVSYGFFALGFCNYFFAQLPWATPPFVLGPLGTGDLRSLIIIAIVFIIGLVIYYPFWKQFENNELRKEKEQEAALAEKEQHEETA